MENLNPEYNIDFSLDHECIEFLKNNFLYVTRIDENIDGITPIL